MPELPEVETLCRQLNAILTGMEIQSVEILDLRLGKVEGLMGRKIEAVSRQGKYIRVEMGESGRLGDMIEPGKRMRKCEQIRLDGGLTALLHLRMTGRLLWQNGGEPVPPHTRLIVSFAAGRLALIDPRRFATFCLRPKEAAPALLPNPLEGLPAGRLREIAGTRRLPVKAFLMDQRLIAGIGNIYVCEILHKAGVNPQRQAGSLKTAEWRKVEKAADAVLLRAVACRGTTVSDWRDLFGVNGTYQDHLKVYSREGEPCSHCGDRIERRKIGGRGTWFCPTCQK